MEQIKIVYLQDDDKVGRKGIIRLGFFTERYGKIFWGTDNNSYGHETIDRWIAEESIYKLKEPLEINTDETLLINYDDSTVYVAELSTDKIKFIVGKFADITL